MDQRWERLRVSMLQHVEAAEAKEDFAELSATLQELVGCSCARDAIDRAQQGRQYAEEISRALVGVWRDRPTLREPIGALLMLCLWKDLTKVFRKQRRPFWTKLEDDLASEIIRAFLNAVADPATSRAPRVADTLVLRTMERVVAMRRRQLRLDGERRRRSQLPEWLNPPARSPREIKRLELTNEIEQLGLEATVEIDLLIEVFRSDHNFDAVAARRGMSRDEVMVRTKRLLARLREHVEEKSTITAAFGAEISSSFGSLELEVANDNAHDDDGGSNDDDHGDKSSCG